MKRSGLIVLLLSLLASVGLPSGANAEVVPVQNALFVAPDGDDDNPGTETLPFATLAKAQTVVRGLNDDMDGDITVYLRGGTYELADTLELTAQDSGTNGYYVNYKNYPHETPVLSGGRTITGWTIHDSMNNIWKADADDLETRQLYVDGQRAVRARSDAGLPGVLLPGQTKEDPVPNVALAANGATATASSTYSVDYPANAVIDGDRKGLNWGSGGGWNDATAGSFPDWVEVTFAGTKSITEINVFTLQDNIGSPIEPTLTTTHSLYGITDFTVQYDNGSGWTTIPDGNVTGNHNVWRNFRFPAVSTDKIRVSVSGAHNAYSRIVEIEAYQEKNEYLTKYDQILTSTGYTIPDASMQSWQNAADIELVYNFLWMQSFCPLDAIQANGGSTDLEVRDPCFSTLHYFWKEFLPNYIENAYELLDEEGEWYLNRATDTLYYKPRAGEVMNEVEVTAARLDKIVDAAGTLNDPVENIGFEGLIFAYAGWLLPNTQGFNNAQGDAYFRPLANPLDNVANDYWGLIPGNVSFSAARNIILERNTFTHLGATGLVFEEGSRNNRVTGNEFVDISGSGIRLGGIDWEDHHPADERRIVKGNRIENNYIHHTGEEYKGSFGIFGGYVQDTTIARNEISEIASGGISLGWGWGYRDLYEVPFVIERGGENVAEIMNNTPSVSRDNKIYSNHIHHVMQDVFDSGCIYMLGAQPGTIIYGNVLHDPLERWSAVYLDNGTRYVTVRENVIYYTHRPKVLATITNVGAYDNDVQYNYWGDSEHDADDPASYHENNWFWFFSGTAVNNRKIQNGNVPSYILDNAGIQPAYGDLLPGPNIDIALGKPAAAYKPNGSPATMPANAEADKAVDGSLDFRAQPSDTVAWTHQTDLRDNYTVDRVKLRFDDTFYATDYEIQVSSTDDNPLSFSTVLTVSSNTAAIREHPLSPVSARYVRVKITAQNGMQAAAIAELEIYGLPEYAIEPLPGVRAVEPQYDIALGKPAAAACTFAQTACTFVGGHELHHGNDGDPATWVQPQTAGYWTYEVDLGKIYNLHELNVHFASGGYPDDYEILVSATPGGGGFASVRTVTAPTAGDSVQRFDPVPARYVRIRTANSTDPMHIAELQAFEYNNLSYGKTGQAYWLDGSAATMQTGHDPGDALDGTAATSALAEPQVVQLYDNLALSRTAAAFYNNTDSSIGMHAGHEADKANDGNEATWAQATGNYEWTWQVDLGAVYNIDRVKLLFPNGAFATEYAVQVATTPGNANFATVKSVTGGTGGVANHAFTSASARYVRIKALKPDGPGQPGNQMGLAEVEVYETGALPIGTQTQYGWTYEADLGAVFENLKTIDVFMNRDSFSTQYSILTSKDGVQYTPGGTFGAGGGGLSPRDIPTVDARYVRIQSTKPNLSGDPGGQMELDDLRVRSVDYALLLSTQTDGTSGANNKYLYQTISENNSVTLQTGDIISYDVKLLTNADQIGAIDIVNSDGSRFRDLSGSVWKDQHNVSGRADADLRSRAYGKWYHRELTVPSAMNGKTPAKWLLAFENDSELELLEAMYNNIRVIRGGTTILEVYRDGHPTGHGWPSNDQLFAGSGYLADQQNGGLLNRDFYGYVQPVTAYFGRAAQEIQPDGGMINVALASQGTTAAASSVYDASYPAASVIDGDRRGLNWGSGGGWNDGTSNAYPDWVELSFGSARTIGEIAVFTLQDDLYNPAPPTSEMTFSLYGIVDFDVQYDDGTAWVTVPGGEIVGNDRVWNRLTFEPVETDKIRVRIHATTDNYSRITEIEAYEKTR